MLRVLLFRDPHLPIEGPPTYEWLDERLKSLGLPGIGPDVSAERVKDLFFDLMARGPTSPEDRLAWDALRIPRRRLLVDFLRHEVARPARVGDMAVAVAFPVPLPDLQPALDEVPLTLDALRPPTQPVPSEDVAVVPVASGALSPLDLGPLGPDWLVTLEGLGG